ncbi:hypothetical protein SD70_12395 [Gordoniibacillus kamchatkensis]|uniref:DUF2569 domain-containing protein n=1 Tax=Gordoniibacillus kamchatkensis TaxID=1590651 RepID=A0ABR5AHW8_9BACL|nr:hypothetical protein [Paenibacillus sp. VKM B-2647]KIL40550.1 hypothetical protein SD70_12395 [Paenibacillus sp. VKM B-2647]
MNPFHEERRRVAAATFIAVLLTVAFSLLGIYNWMELRGFVLSMLAVFKIDPLAWQGVDNMTFLLFGVAWLAYVFYSHYYLRKHALHGRALAAAVRLLAVQMWLLLMCRIVPALFGDTGKAAGYAWMAEAAAALLLTAFWLSGRRSRRSVSINHGERG